MLIGQDEGELVGRIALLCGDGEGVIAGRLVVMTKGERGGAGGGRAAWGGGGGTATAIEEFDVGDDCVGGLFALDGELICQEAVCQLIVVEGSAVVVLPFSQIKLQGVSTPSFKMLYVIFNDTSLW